MSNGKAHSGYVGISGDAWIAGGPGGIHVQQWWTSDENGVSLRIRTWEIPGQVWEYAEVLTEASVNLTADEARQLIGELETALEPGDAVGGSARDSTEIRKV
jgi:hypothetical protein